MKTVALTAGALVCFAANSLLCRLALGDGSIDPVSFTTIRVVSGTAALALLAMIASGPATSRSGSWRSAVWLVVYAMPFSVAYRTLTAGTGALVLFGAVQLTMIGAAIVRGARPHWLELSGAAIAAGGLVALAWPGLAAPPLAGAVLMAAAGVAWGVYSLRGRTGADPVSENAGNFVRALPMVLVLSALTASSAHAGARGVICAVISGVLATGGGYVLWYAALKHLTAFRAAVVQLAVPVVAAAGGVALLGEAMSGQLLGAAVLVLGGLGLALTGRTRAI